MPTNRPNAQRDDVTGILAAVNRNRRQIELEMKAAGFDPANPKDVKRYKRAAREMTALGLKPSDPKDSQRYLAGMKAMGLRR